MVLQVLHSLLEKSPRSGHGRVEAYTKICHLDPNQMFISLYSILAQRCIFFKVLLGIPWST